MNAVVKPSLGALSEYQFYILVDASGSMSDPAKGTSGPSRWAAMEESLKGFARDIETIGDGTFTLVTFGGSKVNTTPGANAAKVAEAFTARQPHGSTPLHDGLTAAFSMIDGTRKTFVGVFTDGVPDDEDKAAAVIAKFTQGLNDTTKDNVRILFVQVGEDPRATAYLEKLDNALPGAKYDIVNAKTADKVNSFNSTAELIASAIVDEHG